MGVLTGTLPHGRPRVPRTAGDLDSLAGSTGSTLPICAGRTRADDANGPEPAAAESTYSEGAQTGATPE